MQAYPAFLNLKGQKAVVVGGGRVAERKVGTLVDAGAVVTVVSPLLTPRLKAAAARGTFRHLRRRYRKTDVNGAFVVVAATDSPEVNSRVASDAPALCNVVDSADLSNFTVPSSVSRGDLCIAVSTGGVSPALARAIRLELQNLYGPAFGRYLKRVRTERTRLVEEGGSPASRRRHLKRLGSRSMLEAIRKGSPP